MAEGLASETSTEAGYDMRRLCLILHLLLLLVLCRISRYFPKAINDVVRS